MLLPGLGGCGIVIPTKLPLSPLPEHELYDLLAAEQGPEAYRLYRSLLRRLVSLENALDIGPYLFPNTAPRKAINAT